MKSRTRRTLPGALRGSRDGRDNSILHDLRWGAKSGRRLTITPLHGGPYLHAANGGQVKSGSGQLKPKAVEAAEDEEDEDDSSAEWKKGSELGAG